MLKGGYIIIDMEDIEFTTGGASFKKNSVFNKMLNHNDKPVLIQNLNVDGTSQDYFVQPVLGNSKFTCTIGDKTFTVTIADYCDVKTGIVGDTSNTNYANLTNKPSINGITLSGNRTSGELGLTAKTGNIEITGDGTLSAIPTTAGQNVSYTHETTGITNAEAFRGNIDGPVPYYLYITGITGSAEFSIEGVFEWWVEDGTLTIYDAGSLTYVNGHLYNVTVNWTVTDNVNNFTLTITCIS